MARKCQHCDGLHLDFDCPKTPKSFSIKYALNQSPDSNTEDEEVASDKNDKRFCAQIRNAGSDSIACRNLLNSEISPLSGALYKRRD